jgi:hypothetical protein
MVAVAIDADLVLSFAHPVPSVHKSNETISRTLVECPVQTHTSGSGVLEALCRVIVEDCGKRCQQASLQTIASFVLYVAVARDVCDVSETTVHEAWMQLMESNLLSIVLRYNKKK